MTDNPAQRVTAERQRRGWSLRQAGARADMSATQWARIEDGDVSISDRSRARIAKAFDWPLDWPEVEPGEPVPSVSRLDDLEDRVRDLEAFVRSLTRSLVDDRERAALAQEVAEYQSRRDEPRHST